MPYFTKFNQKCETKRRVRFISYLKILFNIRIQNKEDKILVINRY